VTSERPAEHFEREGWWLAKGLFADEVDELESEFDRILEQLHQSGEAINARWDTADAGTVWHTHNARDRSPSIGLKLQPPVNVLKNRGPSIMRMPA